MNSTSTRRLIRGISWTTAVIWALFLFSLSFLRGDLAVSALQTAGELLCGAAGALAGGLSPDAEAILTDLTPYILQMLGYMVLALLYWLALRCTGLGRRAAPMLALALSAFSSVLDELNQILTPERVPRILDWTVSFGASLITLACVYLFALAWDKLPRLVNRETVSYVVFGVLTTVVNIVVYLIFFNTLGVHNLISNAIAWVAAVLFAYVVNKLFVFRSHTISAREALREFYLFIAARLFSFGVDELGMLLLVNVAHAGGFVSKVIVNVIVMIMNYFFSKWIIFRQKPSADKNQE